MLTLLLIALGSALGGMARYGMSQAISLSFGDTFPWGTLLVNILGSFIIGVFAALSGPDSRFLIAPEIRQFVMIGLCGGFTTFSSFSLQTFSLLQDNEWLFASLNIILSVMLCLMLTWVGFMTASYLFHLKGV